MSPLDKLIAYFEKFPGIGGRQARRFAFHILTLKPGEAAELASLITSLPDSVATCHDCFRFFASIGLPQTHCKICQDPNRDHTKIMVVARDSDIDAIERSGLYEGIYFVLGGTIPLLGNQDTTGKLRSGALRALITRRLTTGLEEVICAFAVNPDGENTARFTETLVRDTPGTSEVKVSQLGRGLSTGSELEYADPETIKSALKNRS
jgi:recombination protein RecR